MRPTRAEVLSEPAGPRLDAWVAEFVMGQCLHTEGYEYAGKPGLFGPLYQCKTCKGEKQSIGPGVIAVMNFGPKEYSSNIASAWEVVEAIRDRKDEAGIHRWYVRLQDNADRENEWEARFTYKPDKPPFRFVPADAPTAPLAISRAALLAVLEGE